MTENQIMLMQKENHPGALESIYDKYSADMYGLICSLTDDKTLSEKIFVAAFIKLSNKEILLTFEDLLFPNLMRYTYLHTMKALQENPSNGNFSGESGTIMHFLCLKCTSAVDVAFILDIPQQDVGKRLRTESLRLRQ